MIVVTVFFALCVKFARSFRNGSGEIITRNPTKFRARGKGNRGGSGKTNVKSQMVVAVLSFQTVQERGRRRNDRRRRMIWERKGWREISRDMRRL